MTMPKTTTLADDGAESTGAMASRCSMHAVGMLGNDATNVGGRAATRGGRS